MSNLHLFNSQFNLSKYNLKYTGIEYLVTQDKQFVII